MTSSLPRISIMQVKRGDVFCRRDKPDDKLKVLRKSVAGRVRFALEGLRDPVTGFQVFDWGYTLVERDGIVIGELNVK